MEGYEMEFNYGNLISALIFVIAMWWIYRNIIFTEGVEYP